MNDHKQLMTFLIAILALGGGSLTIIFAEINQSEEVFLEHVLEPCHGAACSDIENIKEDVSDIKDDISEIKSWYLQQNKP